MMMKRVALPPPAKSNKEVRAYVRAANKGGRVVIPDSKGWRVVRPDQPNSRFASKKAAVAQAGRELVGTDANVFILNKKGELVDRK